MNLSYCVHVWVLVTGYKESVFVRFDPFPSSSVFLLYVIVVKGSIRHGHKSRFPTKFNITFCVKGMQEVNFVLNDSECCMKRNASEI